MRSGVAANYLKMLAIVPLEGIGQEF